MSAISIPQVYGWNILVASGMALHVVSISFMAVSARKKYKVDYPDMGNGRYAAKLTDEQWKDFNNHQRAHYNYLEAVASVITLQLLSGLFFPKPAAICGLLYMIGRQLYALGYVKNGPKGRFVGAMICHLTFFAQFGLTVFGSLKLLQFF